MPDVGAAGQLGGQRDRRVVHFGQVPRGNTAALGIHSVEMGQLSGQERGLQLVQAGVLALINMVVFVVAAVVAQGADTLGEFVVVRRHTQPASPRAPEVLPG